MPNHLLFTWSTPALTWDYFQPMILFNQKAVVCLLSKVKAYFVSVSQTRKERYAISFSWSRGKKRRCPDCRMMLKIMLSLQENGFSHLNYFQRHTRKSWGISPDKKESQLPLFEKQVIKRDRRKI